MSTERNQSAKMATLLSIFMGILALLVVGQLIRIAVVQGPELRKELAEQRIQIRTVPATRGNLYSADGQLLVTSMPLYALYWDAAVVSSERFSAHAVHAADTLAVLLGQRSAGAWYAYLRKAHQSGKRYVLLGRSIRFTAMEATQTLALFKGAGHEGGLVVEETPKRIRAFDNLAARTLGYDRADAKEGLEGQFSEVLRGRDGSRVMQHLGRNMWKPIENTYAVEPHDGRDLVTTLDVRMQDIADKALRKKLEETQAEYGTAILVEAATGKVRALVNLGRLNGDSGYSETVNYAVWAATEPGSTFKVAALLAGLEEGVVDTARWVATGDGRMDLFPGKAAPITDSKRGGHGNITAGHALEVSSNIGIVKTLFPHFSKHPKDFVDRLYQFGLGEKTGIALPGESRPTVPKPGDKNWYGNVTLSRMMYGYNVMVTPLQTAMFYNALANGGKLMKPLVVEEIRDRGQAVDKFMPVVVHPSICAQESRAIVHQLLVRAVNKGTGRKYVFTDSLSIAGKTGTNRVEYRNSDDGGYHYQVSFAGYFPAENPQYTCVVLLYKPKMAEPSGGAIAGPVFQEIALAVNKLSPAPYRVAEAAAESGLAEAAVKRVKKSDQQVAQAARRARNGVLPNVVGLPGHQALALLENAGCRVRVRGGGRVKKQSVAPGTPLRGVPGTVELVLG
jgi:cell division protein FtsI (penicillin-binding protein 3)